jgi:hypothetical protein
MRCTVVLSCTGIPKEAGAEAATDIAREFSQHRTWHQNVSCTWDGSKLLLTAENDHDPDGLALRDEFSDCISAYIAEGFDGSIRVESAVKHDG